MKHHVACYVDDSELNQLHAMARKNRLSLSRYIRECILLHPEEPRPEPRVHDLSAIETLLRETERRVKQHIDQVADQDKRELLGRIGMLVTMLDQFALAMLINIPEVPSEQREAALQRGDRRYRNWQRAVAEIVQSMEERRDNAEAPDPIQLGQEEAGEPQ